MRTCLRCGQSGHTASECPMPRSSGNSPTKRPATSQSVESMAVGLETGMVTFQDVNGHERVDCTMLVFFCSTLLRCDLLAKKVPGRAPYSQHIIIRNWT